MENNPLFLALMAGLFTWGMTSAGAALVFFFKTINKNVLNIMLGFAAGVMVAASFWSLLLPAQEIDRMDATHIRLCSRWYCAYGYG